MFLEKMKKGLLTMLIASAMLFSIGGSAAPPQEKAKTEVSIQNDAAPFNVVEIKIVTLDNYDHVVIVADSSDFVSVETEKVSATCSSLAAPELELVSVSNASAIHNNYNRLAEPTNSIYKALPFDPGLCRC
jgi:hypothetical protein